jgi:hypothetical protein
MPVERVVSGSVTESAANTFTQSAIACSDYFSSAELEKGVYPVAYDFEVTVGAMSAANTIGHQYAQLTKASKSSIMTINNADLMGKKTLNMAAATNANDLVHLTSRSWGGRKSALGDHMCFKDRIIKVDSTNADTSVYVGIQGTNQAAARSVYYRIRFVIAD